jgi:hypothetical protein
MERVTAISRVLAIRRWGGKILRSVPDDLGRAQAVDGPSRAFRFGGPMFHTARSFCIGSTGTLDNL